MNPTPTIDLRALSAAVVHQAHIDLQSTCGRMRRESVEFLNSPSLWTEILGLDIESVKDHLEPQVKKAYPLDACRKFVKIKAFVRCPECGKLPPATNQPNN